MTEFDLLVKNVRLVRANVQAVPVVDIGIQAGRFVEIAPHIDASRAQEIFDADMLLGFPGVVDPHVHFGIYRPMDEDSRSESQAAAAGGVTTTINYLRSGTHYLNRGGPYADYFPDVLHLLDGNTYEINESLGRLTKQEEFRFNRERALAAKVESVLYRILGVGNSQVEVNASFTFPNETATTRKFDSANKVPSREFVETEKTTGSVTEAAGTAGVANNVGNAGRSSESQPLRGRSGDGGGRS